MSERDKRELISLYDFARSRIILSMELRHCPHAGFYNRVDERCHHCHQGMECQWMNSNDELVSLESKTLTQLRQQLLIALDYVDASLTPHHLSRRDCQCENCRWRRETERVLASTDPLAPSPEPQNMTPHS